VVVGSCSFLLDIFWAVVGEISMEAVVAAARLPALPVGGREVDCRQLLEPLGLPSERGGTLAD
jgi:hypothetical protein